MPWKPPLLAKLFSLFVSTISLHPQQCEPAAIRDAVSSAIREQERVLHIRHRGQPSVEYLKYPLPSLAVYLPELDTIVMNAFLTSCNLTSGQDRNTLHHELGHYFAETRATLRGNVKWDQYNTLPPDEKTNIRFLTEGIATYFELKVGMNARIPQTPLRQYTRQQIQHNTALIYYVGARFVEPILSLNVTRGVDAITDLQLSGQDYTRLQRIQQETLARVKNH